jgi:NTE family protein
MASDKIENVLILQGGGSLGSFACGVLKSLVTKGIKIDIVAGTSIGGVDAAIIAGSDHPERMLEEFWLELANNSVDLTSPLMHSIVRESALLSGFKGHILKEDQINAILNTIS